MTNRIKRRNVMSYPQAQLKIIAFFLCMAVVYSAVNYYVATHAVQVLFDDISALDLGSQVRHDVNVVVQREQGVLEWQLKIFTFLSILMLSLGAVIISHRAGGPIYQMRKYLQGLVDGTVPPRPIRFRQNDFFPELAAAFNRFQEKQGLIPPASSAPAGKPDRE